MTAQPQLFSDDWKWFAFPASLDLPAVMAAYAAPAADNGEVFPTLLCGWDDAEHSRKRGMALGSTAPIIPLSDGRLGSAGLPTLALLAAWQAGEIEGEVLTEEQFRNLQIQSDL